MGFQMKHSHGLDSFAPVASFFFCVTLVFLTIVATALAEEEDGCWVLAKDAIPATAKIYAAGGYGGAPLEGQIDQSGHDATLFTVRVNEPGHSVVLMLAAYEPAIWSIEWTSQTKISAVLVSGHHKAVVTGLPKSVPIRIKSQEATPACQRFSTEGDGFEQLNPVARQAFGRPVDLVFRAVDGLVTIGSALPSGAKLTSVGKEAPETLFDRNAPLAGLAGIEAAVARGVLREATKEDLDAWDLAFAKRHPKDVPTIAPQAGAGGDAVHDPSIEPDDPGPRSGFPFYVVLKPFVLPRGLYGANSASFIVPLGVSLPTGELGHAAVLDVAHGVCYGLAGELGQCEDRLPSAKP